MLWRQGGVEDAACQQTDHSLLFAKINISLPLQNTFLQGEIPLQHEAAHYIPFDNIFSGK